jgi:hypothetical protein
VRRVIFTPIRSTTFDNFSAGKAVGFSACGLLVWGLPPPILRCPRLRVNSRRLLVWYWSGRCHTDVLHSSPPSLPRRESSPTRGGIVGRCALPSSR